MTPDAKAVHNHSPAMPECPWVLERIRTLEAELARLGPLYIEAENRAEKAEAHLRLHCGAYAIDGSGCEEDVVMTADSALRLIERANKAEARVKELRPELREFALQMECVLKANDGQKGDSWKDPDWSLRSIRSRLTEELDEFDREFIDKKGEDGNLREIVDVANFCFFMWWHLRERLLLEKEAPR